MTDNTPVISIKNLTKCYQDKATKKIALDHIDLDIYKGDMFGLLGPNGAGKSTLINILAGTTLKTSGEVFVMGHSIETDPIKASRCLGIVPQELVLDPYFTIYEMLDMYAGFYGIPSNERKTKEIIEALGLSDKMHVKARSLSGGMKRRLLVAKALVHTPPIVILDEPTAGVDIDLRNSLWNYIKRINKEKQTTIILTTHYLEEAEHLCNRLSIINKGKIEVTEDKDSLLNSVPSKEIFINIDSQIEQIPEYVKDKFKYKVVDVNNAKQVSILYSPNSGDLTSILKAFQDADISIKELRTVEANLEDVFLSYTKKTGN